MRDSQQQKFYRWENTFTAWPGPHASRKQLLATIKKCCRLYRVRVPTVQLLARNRGKPSQYVPWWHQIRLRPRHNDTASAIHESAHAIIDWLLGADSTEPHGPEFVAVYINLLDRLKVAPTAMTAPYAKRYGLRVSRISRCSPENIRDNFRKFVDAAKFERQFIDY